MPFSSALADTGIAARNNLSQDLLLHGEWKQGWKLYNQRFRRKPGNYPIFENAFGASQTTLPDLDQPILPLMSEQGLGDTCNSDTPLLCKTRALT